MWGEREVALGCIVVLGQLPWSLTVLRGGVGPNRVETLVTLLRVQLGRLERLRVVAREGSE
jgi:hypothetical protein